MEPEKRPGELITDMLASFVGRAIGFAILTVLMTLAVYCAIRVISVDLGWMERLTMWDIFVGLATAHCILSYLGSGRS